MDEDWEHRTEDAPVNTDAVKEARNLFSYEVRDIRPLIVAQE